MPALLSSYGLTAPAPQQSPAAAARKPTVVVDARPAGAVLEDDRRLEARRILLRGLTMVGLLVGLGWALAFGAPQDPELLQRMVGDAPVARAGLLVALGAATGCALAAALVLTALRSPAPS